MRVAADRVAARLGAILLFALGALPVATWIPGGLRDPAFTARWAEWWYGSLIVAGIGIVTAMLSRAEAHPFAWRARLPQLESAASEVRVALVLAGAATIIYGAVAFWVFSGRPLLIDELVQMLQARMYASGHLSTPTDPLREFFSVLHVVDIGSRTYSQFPPGWPSMLAAFMVLHLPAWLAGPVCGGVATWLFARLLRITDAFGSRRRRIGAAAVFALAPFSVFQFGSHMSHGPVLMWLLVGMNGLIVMQESWQRARPGVMAALLTGAGFGVAFAVRPLDAVAFGTPAALWLLWTHGRTKHGWMHLAPAIAAAAIPIAGTMLVNVETTGSPFLFGYEALWGPLHGLGFHASPWGDAHTPQRGLELLSVYATRLNTYLFETPFPSLLVVCVGLWTVSRLTALERFIGIATAIHAACYFAYWHDGFYLGPRFIVPWIPLLSIAAIHAVDAIPSAPRRRAGVNACVLASAIIAIGVSVPTRVVQYSSGLTSMRADYGAAARAAGATHALVFVRESWGAELVARMWARGVSRPIAAALYANTDACVLDRGLRDVERENARDVSAERSLLPLLRDSLRVVPSMLSPDSTERVLPGATYDSTCAAHLERDQQGYALYPPFLLDDSSGNVYVRDILGRDDAIIERYPGMPVFEVSRAGVDGMSPLIWRRIR